MASPASSHASLAGKLARLLIVSLALALPACGGGSSSAANGSTSSIASGIPPALVPMQCNPSPVATPAANAPTIALNGARVIAQTLNKPYLDAGATASDAKDGDISSHIVVTGLSELDVSRRGDYLLRYNVTNSAGAAAGESVRVVRVSDGQFAARTARPAGTTNTAMGYYERLPIHYGDDPGKRFPLIIYVHGAGEVGSNLNLLAGIGTQGVTENRDTTALIDPDQDSGKQPFVVLWPQRCAQVVVATELRAFIAYAANSYSVDPARIYLVGLSAGGAQIWSYLESYQDQVAAAVPMAGIDITRDPCAFKDVPVWAFHAVDDDRVPASNSINVINKLRTCNPAPRERPKLTMYPAGGHVIDTPTLTLTALGTGWSSFDLYQPDIYTWLLQHHR